MSFFTNIENNLIALKTLEVNHQASEYAELLSEALQIGVSVHQEMQGPLRPVRVHE
ncbi:hypothetical protein [Leptothermofonsia sp. ETS-13]|uniref:hypothetical protein n=1 Tax=Leptothermofonsia sp. ETS-13 TaxID=3035696 RepID=UPI003B9FA9BC